jgi:hypothetical protein
MLDEKTKKSLIPIIITIAILVLAVLGYVFLSRQTKETTDAVKKESMAKLSPQVQKYQTAPSAQPRALNLNNQPKAEQTAILYLETDTNIFTQGSVINVLFNVEAKDDVLDGVQAVLQYNPKMIQVGQPKQASFFSQYPQLSVDKDLGQIKIIALQKAEENKTVLDEVVVTLPVTLLNPGTVTLDFINTECEVSGYGGQSLLKDTIPLSFTIVE